MTGDLTSMWWGLLLLGLGAGIISGTLGLGSGTILIPVMVMAFGFAQKSAQGTALAVMVPMALVGAIRYWKNPEIEVNMAAAAILAAGAVAGALIGFEFASRVRGGALKKIFAVYLLVVGLKILIPWGRLVPWEISRGPGDGSSVEREKAALIRKGNESDSPGNTPGG